MPIKIKKRLRALTFAERAKPKFFRMVNRFIKDEILGMIEKGISPVNQRDAKIKNTGNKNRFKQYSDSYKTQIKSLDGKKQRPINLKVSGKLLNSIKSRKTGKGVKVWFSDKKAKYHNDLGAGKSKVVRRILPRDGESWARRIEKLLVQALEKAIRGSR